MIPCIQRTAKPFALEAVVRTASIIRHGVHHARFSYRRVPLACVRIIVPTADLHSLTSSSPVPLRSCHVCHALQATSSTATRGRGVQAETNRARHCHRHPQQRLRRARRRWRVQQFERRPTAGEFTVVNGCETFFGAGSFYSGTDSECVPSVLAPACSG